MRLQAPGRGGEFGAWGGGVSRLCGKVSALSRETGSRCLFPGGTCGFLSRTVPNAGSTCFRAGGTCLFPRSTRLFAGGTCGFPGSNVPDGGSTCGFLSRTVPDAGSTCFPLRSTCGFGGSTCLFRRNTGVLRKNPGFCTFSRGEDRRTTLCRGFGACLRLKNQKRAFGTICGKLRVEQGG